ncbi:16S rRNA methyltransferase [Candidatus Bathyarchaeota archaeon]|nr:16S rRNA methyltransferase [Candidatus Bathyarchaeota archaeon]
MINIVYVESSLELVPSEIIRHPSVRRNAKRKGKPPEENLLDRSLHHWAMDRLDNSEKRGRPDIIHFLLLEALGSPLNKTGELRIWIHTVQDLCIYVNPEARLPRDYNRFKSLIEQLYVDGRSPPNGDTILLELRKININQLRDSLNPDFVIGLTSRGEPSSFETLSKSLCDFNNPMVCIGAFPHGPYQKETASIMNKQINVYPEPLEAWIVNSRLIYELEKCLNVYNSQKIL